MNVTLGSPGTAAVAGDPEVDVPDVPYTVESNGPDQNEAKVINTNTLDVIGQSLVFDLASLNDAQRTAFEDALPNGVLVGNYYTLTPGYHVIDNLDVLNGPALVPDSNYLYNTNGFPRSLARRSTNSP